MSIWKNAAEYIRGLSKTLDRPIGTLIALTTTNDPFHASMPGRIERAQWFADLYKKTKSKSRQSHPPHPLSDDFAGKGNAGHDAGRHRVREHYALLAGPERGMPRREVPQSR